MWETFTAAPSQMVAEMWCDFLKSQSIPCRLYSGDVTSFLGVATRAVRLMTRKEFVDQARQAIADLENSEDSPYELG